MIRILALISALVVFFGSKCVEISHKKISMYSPTKPFINICQHQSSQQQHTATSINIVSSGSFLVSELVSLCLQRQHSQHKQHVSSKLSQQHGIFLQLRKHCQHQSTQDQHAATSINIVGSSSFLVSEFSLCLQRQHSQHKQHVSSKLSQQHKTFF